MREYVVNNIQEVVNSEAVMQDMVEVTGLDEQTIDSIKRFTATAYDVDFDTVETIFNYLIEIISGRRVVEETVVAEEIAEEAVTAEPAVEVAEETVVAEESAEVTPSAVVEPKGKKYLYTVTLPSGEVVTSLRTKDTYTHVVLHKEDKRWWMLGMNGREDLAVNSLEDSRKRVRNMGRNIVDSKIVAVESK